MIYPNFTKDEQKAILHIASAVAFNGDGTKMPKDY